jgi:uncharacterized protein YndB with AHSA1/START domain
MAAENKPSPSTSNSGRELVTTRVFDAPRELVFDAWTNPAHVTRWWGPNGFSTTTQQMDVRPGGVWKYTMHGPDGANYPNTTAYKEVVRPERLVYTQGGAREGGPGIQFTSTVTFDDVSEGGRPRTKVTMRALFPTAEALALVIREYKADEGGRQHLGRLAQYLPTMPGLDGSSPIKPFIISRTFKAPRDLVFKCWTEPQHMEKWWGPKGVSVQIVRFEPHPGGLSHYCMTTPDGHKMWGKSIFREITPRERIVFVNAFSDEHRGLTRHPMSPTWPLEMLTTITFVDAGPDKTTVTIQWVPISATPEERATFDSGRDSMTMGWTGSLDQLESYLPTIKA